MVSVAISGEFVMPYHSKLLISIKDFSGKFTFVNNTYLNIMGYNHDWEIVGRHLSDVSNEVFKDSIGGVESLTEQILKEDECVFRGQELNIVYAHKWRHSLKFLVANKSPYRNENHKIIGSMATHHEIYNPPLKLLNAYLALENENLIISDQSKKHIQSYINDFLKNIILNSRELECVRLLAIGNTAKEIARQLGLSHRTVESHLDHAKNKLDCSNSHVLVAKCFTKGWIEIPGESVAF